MYREIAKKTAELLPRKFHGQRGLEGYCPRGCKVGHNRATELTHTAMI